MRRRGGIRERKTTNSSRTWKQTCRDGRSKELIATLKEKGNGRYSGGRKEGEGDVDWRKAGRKGRVGKEREVVKED